MTPPTSPAAGTPARVVATWEIGDPAGPAVAIDVIRAFTTAAYAFGAGAKVIHLVAEVDDARRLLADNPTWLAMGEERGLRPEGFALSNSPAQAFRADLDGRVIVQRTSAGTRGALAARHARPLLCASLVVASANAAYLQRSGSHARLTYVITGRFADAPDATGDEDLAAAEYIEALRRGVASAPGAAAAVRRVLASPDAAHTMNLGPDHVDPADLHCCVAVDRFAFAMVASPNGPLLTLHPVRP